MLLVDLYSYLFLNLFQTFKKLFYLIKFCELVPECSRLFEVFLNAFNAIGRWCLGLCPFVDCRGLCKVSLLEFCLLWEGKIVIYLPPEHQVPRKHIPEPQRHWYSILQLEPQRTHTFKPKKDLLSTPSQLKHLQLLHEFMTQIFN